MTSANATRVHETLEYAVRLETSLETKLTDPLTKTQAEALADHHNSSVPLFEADAVKATVVTRQVKTIIHYSEWV